MKLVMSVPPRNSRGDIIPLLVGDFISINFIGHNEVSVVTMKIVEKKMDANITLVLSDAASSEEHQRRQHFRLSTKMEELEKNAQSSERVDKIAVSVHEKGDKKDIAPFQIKLINISGGGILCAVYELMPHLNSILNLQIEIPGISIIYALGKISRMERLDYQGDMVFMTGISFLEIKESDREAIINFVFEEHAAQKKIVDLRG